jgi:hypothetical protein
MPRGGKSNFSLFHSRGIMRAENSGCLETGVWSGCNAGAGSLPRVRVHLRLGIESRTRAQARECPPSDGASASTRVGHSHAWRPLPRARSFGCEIAHFPVDGERGKKSTNPRSTTSSASAFPSQTWERGERGRRTRLARKAPASPATAGSRAPPPRRTTRKTSLHAVLNLLSLHQPEL